MSENERERQAAERFHRDLDAELSGRRPTEPPDDPEALKLARRLHSADFSRETGLEPGLRRRLAEQAARQVPARARRNVMMQRANTLSQWAVWAGLAVGMFLLIGWIFRSTLVPGSIPTATPTQARSTEAVVLPTEAIRPTDAPLETPVLSGDPLTPTLQAAALLELDWSPDGRWLAVKAQTAGQRDESLVSEGWAPPAPGTVHLINPLQDRRCEYEQNNPAGLNLSGLHAWLGDGRLLTLDASGLPVALSDPCRPETAEPLPGIDTPVTELLAKDPAGDTLYFNSENGCFLWDAASGTVSPVEACSREASFSPDGALLGMTVENGTNYTTEIFQAGSSERLHAIPWFFSEGGLGSLPAPDWLSDTALVIARSDNGPMLVTSAGFSTGAQVDIETLAPRFGQPEAGYHLARGIPAGRGGSYHILFTSYGPDYSQRRNWLYHSEDGAVEELPFVEAEAAGDGQWLSLVNAVTVAGYEQSERWLRPLDPPGSQAFLALPAGVDPLAWALNINPNGAWLASAGRAGSLALRALPGLAPLHAWNPGPGYSFYPIGFSPIDFHLYAVGSKDREQALFLIAVLP